MFTTLADALIRGNGQFADQNQDRKIRPNPSSMAKLDRDRRARLYRSPYQDLW